MEGEPGFGKAGIGVRVAIIVTHVFLMPLTLAYSFFVPLEHGSWWLYAGLAVSLLGVALVLAASVTFVTAPLEEPLTTGAYAVSRHPIYASTFLVYAGVGLAGTSWVFLLAAVIGIGAYRLGVPEEERNMRVKYGPAYEDYMRRTPRWLGIPKRPSKS
jgi:protein-S-isoprenylcysteine O-methyltransferase Ste14